MKKALLVILLMPIWIGGCDVDTAKDTQAVKDTIRRYNQLLAEGYARMNMTPLREVATEEHTQKPYHHMSALGEAKIRMESELVDIEFLDIQLPKKDLAGVRTREKWNYSHTNIDSKMPSQTVVQGLIYTLSYELVRNDGRWFVSSVSAWEEEKPEMSQKTRGDAHEKNEKTIHVSKSKAEPLFVPAFFLRTVHVLWSSSIGKK